MSVQKDDVSGKEEGINGTKTFKISHDKSKLFALNLLDLSYEIGDGDGGCTSQGGRKRLHSCLSLN